MNLEKYNNEKSVILGDIKCEKFGELGKAMQCLTLMGDKQKVVSFANTCKQGELYITAANFLQGLEWTDDVVSNIVQFFSKAKAWSNLSNFYETCASVEISEYRNYEKALENYDQALKIIINKISSDDKMKATKEEELTAKIKITKMYGNALESSKKSSEDALAVCNTMLNLSGINKVVREVDIYSLMLDIYIRNKDYSSAFSVLEVLRTSNYKITRFVEVKTIEVILKSVNKLEKLNDYTGAHIQNEEDIIDEEIS